MVRNKAILVTKVLNQIEVVDFEETFVPMMMLEAIQLLLTFSYFKIMNLYK